MSRDEAGNSVAEFNLAVPSMVCDGCAETIRTALMALPGVHEVNVSLWRRRVRVGYEPALVQPAQLRSTVIAAGFTVADT